MNPKTSACGKFCTFSAFLIGQIGKNRSIADNPLNLESILTECYTQLRKAAAVVGGMLTVLECKNDQKLIQLYRKHGFEQLDIGQSAGLVSMCKIIDFDKA